jgi:transcriptional regulator GlxA family with amidase domain
MVETPYTVAEVAELTGFSPQMVTRLFENEPGVLIAESEGAKRVYRSIRIPRAVYERVIRKLSVQ